MKVLKIRIALRILFLAIGINSCTSLPPNVSNQIVLNSEMIINECACGNAEALIDEQNSFGLFAPVSFWNYKKCRVKPDLLSAVIDLGAEYQITKVHFFDGLGDGELSISYGKPFEWQLLLSDQMQHFQYWNSKQVNVKTRYLQLKSKDLAIPIEIILEGKKTNNLSIKRTVPNTTQHPEFGKFMGTNAFIDDPIGLFSPFGTIREYHLWFAWNQPSKNQIAFNPTDQGFNFDIYYTNLKKLGITASPVLQQSPKWITGLDNSEAKSIAKGSDSYEPESYLEHAQFIYQFAARYGSGNADVTSLKLNANQDKKANLGVLQYYENWNEQDKWWRGRESFFSPYEYAAMSSADLDGHLGKLGKEAGIRNADPNAKLVLGGLADPNLNYIKALKFWSDHNRKGDFPWSAINLHYYSNDGGGQFQSKKGISPEEDHLKDKLQLWVDYRNKYLPNVEIWLSEFGYDVKDDSPQQAPEIGSMNREQVQAIWLVRSYLAVYSTGVDKMYQYMIRDTEGKGIYASSGLYYWEKEGENKKVHLRPAWYYLATLQKLLGKLYFDKEIDSKNENIRIYAFKASNNSKKKVYAIWCTTNQDLKIQDYTFNFPEKVKFAWKVTLADKKSKGEIEKISLIKNSTSLEITEKPIFVVSDENSEFSLSPEDRILKLNAAMLSSSEGKIPLQLADEQDKIGDPDKGILERKPSTSWEVGYNLKFPVYADIDLGKEYLVTKLYLRDGNGSGNVRISIGSPNNWKLVDNDNLKSYNSWKAHVIGEKTRYIRLSKESASGTINEIAIYVQD